jgi:Flp pilus assembly protein TadG
MRLKLGRSRSKRPRQRGVAAVEFALCLVLVVPLMLGVMDYGYYFYVGVNVVAAAQAGILAAANTVVTDCSGSATAAQVTARGNAQTAAVAAETAALHNANGVGNTGLDAVVTLYGSAAAAAPKPTCSNTPMNPTWTLTLVADFKPALGWVAPWMKVSPTTAGKARFTAHKIAMFGD